MPIRTRRVETDHIVDGAITFIKLASDAIPPKTYYQDAEPTSGMNEGDYWIDTDDNNKIYIYKNGAWVAIAAAGVTTFRQSSVPTALSAGDLWIDTDDDKLYRATAAGDDAITPGEWELIDAAKATGWSHGLDVTKIDGGKIYTGTVIAAAISVAQLSAIAADLGTITAGLITGATIRTAAGNPRVELTGTTLKVYDESGNVRVILGDLS